MQLLVSPVLALSLLLCLAPAGGCQMPMLVAGNAYHMTAERATAPRIAKQFRVLDAETRQPVAGAWLVVVHNFDWMDDWTMSGTADAAGVAKFQLASDYLHLLQVNAGADGYLTRDNLSFGPIGRSGNGPERGLGPLSDDPVDVYLFKGPAPTVGYRVPAGYRGPVDVRAGPTKYDFPFPPDFPAGQRVWWADVKPGATTLAEQTPRMGWDPRGAPGPAPMVDSDGRAIPVAHPGAEFDGVAYWPIGSLEPKGPWGQVQPVTLIGTRAEAIALAKQVWEQHHNGPTGFILNGWLKVVSPQTKRQGPLPEGVTRFGMRR
jgi:hypothetical protein